MTAEPSRNLQVEGNNLRFLGCVNLDRDDPMAAVRAAVRQVIDAGYKELVLDFTHAHVLTSAVITLTFLVNRELEGQGVALHVMASLKSHRPLAAAGLGQYVQLHLCG